MPIDQLDPRALLLGQAQQARVPYDAPDIVEERRARVEQLREAAKAKQDAQYEQQLYDWAIKSNLGPDGTPDLEGVRRSLWQVSPPAARKFATAVATGKKQQAETYKLEDDHRAALTGWAAQAFNNADDTNYGNVFPVVQRGAPDLVKQYGLTGDYQHDQGAIGALRNAATSMPEQNKHSEDLRQSALKSEYDQALAQWIDRQGSNFKDDQPTADALEGKFHELANLGAPSSWIQDKRNRGIDDLRDTFAPNVLTTPAQRAARQDAQDAAAALTANRVDQGLRADQTATETARHNRALEDAAQQRIDKPPAGRAAAGPAAPVTIEPGTPDYKVAQDLAFGRMTSSFFRTLEAYNRDAGKKAALYAKAAEINPNFNQADFERGFRFAANPQTMRQLAALDNALSGIPSLLEASDAAQRSGATVLNKYADPVKVAMGSQKFSNLKAARLAWADEVSGGLGFGTASDMKLQLGLDLTDDNLSVDNFRSAIQTVIKPFLDRKRDTIYKQMGPYGTPEGNSSISKAYTGEVRRAADGRMLGRVNGQTVEVVKSGDGWVVK